MIEMEAVPLTAGRLCSTTLGYVRLASMLASLTQGYVLLPLPRLGTQWAVSARVVEWDIDLCCHQSYH